MSRLSTSFILGYHGCDAKIASQAISGKIQLITSDKAYDWLGPGAYFWEADPRRAAEWAKWKVDRGEYKRGAVVGAVIDLRKCLDLSNREDVELVRDAYGSFVAFQTAAAVPIPENKMIPNQPDLNRSLRYLDCAVIKHLHTLMEDSSIEPYDTVRGSFTEGPELYPGCGFAERSHVQIAVRNSACILGTFLPRGDDAKAVQRILRKPAQRKLHEEIIKN